jgi:hypothetical protein
MTCPRYVNDGVLPRATGARGVWIIRVADDAMACWLSWLERAKARGVPFPFWILTVSHVRGLYRIYSRGHH